MMTCAGVLCLCYYSRCYYTIPGKREALRRHEPARGGRISPVRCCAVSRHCYVCRSVRWGRLGPSISRGRGAELDRAHGSLFELVVAVKYVVKLRCWVGGGVGKEYVSGRGGKTLGCLRVRGIGRCDGHRLSFLCMDSTPPHHPICPSHPPTPPGSTLVLPVLLTE